MNCDEYRETLAANPSFDGGAGHLSECGDCQAYRREMLELDQAIGRALAIDVPPLVVPDLPEIEADNIVALPRRRRSPTAMLAMAATVVLAAFIGFRMLGPEPQYESLADQLLAHLEHEPYALRVTDEPVSDSRLTSVVPANLADLTSMIALATNIAKGDAPARPATILVTTKTITL